MRTVEKMVFEHSFGLGAASKKSGQSTTFFVGIFFCLESPDTEKIIEQIGK